MHRLASGTPVGRSRLLLGGAVIVGAAVISLGSWLTLKDDESPGAANRPSPAPQLEREYVGQIESALKNGVPPWRPMADNLGDYSGDAPADLDGLGLNLSPGVSLPSDATRTRYCITATHERLPDGHPSKTATYDSESGALSERDSCA